MKKVFVKFYIVSLVLLLFSFSAFAQKFTTHPVKKGETIQSIAKQYKVSPESILNLNKEVKNANELKLNTILVINLEAKVTSDNDAKPRETANNTVTVITQEEPIGFVSYEVKRRDNLFRISERFKVSQDAIKRYNKELYATQLKKGMTLKIPKFRKIEVKETTVDETLFEEYTVQPKENRFSIASRYGISIDSLLVLNPDLSKDNTYLAAGQKLRLPILAGSTTENQTSQLFMSYTVPPKKGFLALEREFGVTENEIKMVNPELNERGLQEGMVIRIPQKTANKEAVNTENFNFYEVKPGEAEYSLTRKLGLSYRELLSLNPELQSGLKAGMILKIPKANEGNFVVKNSLIIENIDLISKMNTAFKPNLVIMLPFRLDLINVNNSEAAKDSLKGRRDANWSLALYSGALVALDSIKKLGLSVNVSVFDTERNMNRTKELLLKSELKNAHAIIGPLDPESLKEVAVRVLPFQVPLIAPIHTKSDISLSNVFYAVPSEDNLREQLLSFVKEKRVAENIVVIADDAHEVTKKLLLKEFPKAKALNLVEKFAMKDKILALLSSTEENWVFLETDQFSTVNSVISVLNASRTDKIKIRLFTTNKNKAYDDEKINHSHLSNLAFTYPTIEGEDKNDAFERAYMKMNNGKSPDKYAHKGFDITMDVLLKLAYKNNLFEASKNIGETRYSNTKYNYVQKESQGYYNTGAYIMMYDNMWIKEAK
ncbi:LysM peptidoglycan-binding domain-containing protein [Cellulophaga sp. Hel_I_12]|uniref:LysM peptidoglycan-binding domain-containing protein n=1 Tax=Cellulophaga sp. Hel_I_12 TaxID=1249972 RepID=UPI000646E5AA|nr:LysM peptidoglycan-binding domain-containing protein [Cellulophaga sp. Hel_I_12]